MSLEESCDCGHVGMWTTKNKQYGLLLGDKDIIKTLKERTPTVPVVGSDTGRGRDRRDPVHP